MDFGLSEDQVLLKDTIKRFLAEQCPTTRVRQIMEGDSGAATRALDGARRAGRRRRDRAGGARRARSASCSISRWSPRSSATPPTPGPFLGCGHGDGRARRGRRRRRSRPSGCRRIAAGEALAHHRAGRGERRVDAGGAARRASTAAGSAAASCWCRARQLADVIVVAAQRRRRARSVAGRARRRRRRDRAP